jgi:YggT family protein
MGSSYLSNPLVFIIDALFMLYTIAFMLRLLMQLVRADFRNPPGQFIIAVTNPLLVPLRRIIPGWGGVDMAAILIMLLLQFINQFLILFIKGGSLHPLSLLILAVAALVQILLQLYFFTILIQVILSWVNPHAHNPLTYLLYQINAPVMRPVQNLIPPISGFDLSPIFVLLGIQVLNMLLIPPLQQLALRVAVGL